MINIDSILGSGPPYDIDRMAYLATAIECYLYAREHMVGTPRFADRHELLDFAIGKAPAEGLVLEFGVFSGSTVNQIADRLPDKTIFGFDSFEGLPEDWTPGAPTGHFKRKDLPAVGENVELVVGYFDAVLPRFLSTHADPVAFIHIDCDLYFSTQTVLSQLRDRIISGTVIVFDEYFNYPEWRFHEFRAFQEFVSQGRIKYEYIGLAPNFEQVAVRIM
ncbi:MAG: TylF/MycF/NovP-related O-methyltransferase [Caulobacteraceae bacterium]|nr:TylF/MycF/NovP-related O-methyltransferase [Caulobacteraceae bacterium]